MSDFRRQILFLIPSLRGGGAERVIINLLRHLDRSRFKPVLAVVDLSDAVYRDEVPDDVELIDLHCSRIRYALPGIVAQIWQRRPDVVFSTLGHLNLALAMIRPLLPNGTRYIARETCTVTEVISYYRRPAFWRWAYRRYYGWFDDLVCQSQHMLDDLVTNFDFPADKAVVIHNPIDVERIRLMAAETPATGFEPGDDENGGVPIRLVAAGRLSHQKGFDLLIDALAICDNPLLHLTILGEGPLRGELERLAEEKGVARQVRFAGFQNNPYPYFAQADAFILSSRYEGFPNAVLEALACGTPVIATPAMGAVAEILDGVEGCVLAKDGTAEELVRAIRAWLTSDRRRIRPDVVDPYSVLRILPQYQAILYKQPVSTTATTVETCRLPGDSSSANRFAVSEPRYWLVCALFALVSLILAMRPIYTAPDDLSYIDYFSGTYIINYSDWWSSILNEPLWNIYTKWTGSLVGAETGIRITIFLASIIFLIFGTKLARGAWLLVLTVFILDSTLATQMYFNQIRQGFALSLFMMLVGVGAGPLVAAISAATIHSSFLLMIPSVIAARLIGNRNRLLVLSLLAIVAGSLFLKSYLDLVDFGRRSQTYELEGKLNIYYYIVTFVQYGIPFYLLKQTCSDELEKNWYRLALIFTTLSLTLTLIHEAGARLMYIANALVLIMIGKCANSNKKHLIVFLWLFFLLFIVLNEGQKLGFNEDTWFGRWALIFS